MPSDASLILFGSDREQLVAAASGSPARSLPAFPWSDPHSVPPGELAAYIASVESACAKNPHSSDLRTCLGIALAMNYDAYGSMDALERAVQLDPASFIAQYKYAELHYRLRILIRAEQEGVKAAARATNAMELGMAQRLLREIRRLHREGTQKPEWTKPLMAPALVVLALALILSLAMYLKL